MADITRPVGTLKFLDKEGTRFHAQVTLSGEPSTTWADAFRRRIVYQEQFVRYGFALNNRTVTFMTEEENVKDALLVIDGACGVANKEEAQAIEATQTARAEAEKVKAEKQAELRRITERFKG